MQHSQDYYVEDMKLTSLAQDNHGYYKEINIVNHTTSNLVMVDRFDNVTSLSPEASATRNLNVVIYVRECTGTRVDSKSGRPVEVPAKKITIPQHVIQNTSCYIKEIDAVFCRSELSEYVEHPAREGTFDENTQELFERLTAEQSLLSVQAIANDPDGLREVVYLAYMGKTIEIPVLHQPDEDCYVKFFVREPSAGGENGKIYTVRFHFSEIENDKGYVELGNGEIIHLSSRYDKLENGLKNVKRKAKATVEEIDNVKKEKDNEWKETVETLKKEHESEKAKLNNKIQEKEQSIREKEDQINRLQHLINGYESQQKHEEQIQQRERQKEQTEAEREKTKKAKFATQSELGKTLSQGLNTLLSLLTLLFTLLK